MTIKATAGYAETDKEKSMKNTVYSALLQAAEKQPDAIAVEDTETRLTFRELKDAAARISLQLPAGCRRAGIVMDHGALQIASIFGVLKSGAAYIPAEPFLPLQRIHYMLEEGEAEVVLTDRAHASMDFGCPVMVLDSEILMQKSEASEAAEDHSEPEDLAYILYTSGSTGKPKGVMVENRNITHYVRAFQNEFHPGPEDAMLQFSVCSFDIFTEEVFTSLLSGARLVIIDQAIKDDLPKLMDFAIEHSITMISGFPYLLQKLNDLDQLPSSIRLLISGGDVIRHSYIDRLLKLPVEIYNTYGPSETTVCASYFHCEEETQLEDDTFPIGKPVKGTEIEIIDPDGKACRPYQKGEIIIKGGGVSRGYAGTRPAEQQAFFTDKDGKRSYASGDLGYFLPDGNIAFLGRKDDQIMIDGRRVEPKEVESVLSSSSDVYQSAVLHFEDQNHMPYMTAYVVFTPEHASLQELRAYASDYLTDYMIPSRFREVESIPMTINGKVDQKALMREKTISEYNA